MKRILLLTLICWPVLVQAQSFVNPDTIHQRGDIILHTTNVYYNPVLPPSDSDTREGLCNESDLLLDSNGVGSQWRDYDAMTRDSLFWMTHPFTDVYHPNKWTVWQRLFQALDKPAGTHSDIIAGGNVGDSVIVSKNEDVDFRASGTIKLKNGFHAKPGCFFHAYQDPKWDTAVFSDEFNDTATFRYQWYVANGYGGSTSGPAANEVQSSDNVNLVRDTGSYGAHDGYALDLMMRMDTNNLFSCHRLIYSDTGCSPVLSNDTSTFYGIFSTSFIRSCPYPYQYTTGGLGPPAYAHAPYGKYEFRQKIPDVLFHTNNWGSTWDMEYDINETQNATMGAPHPGLGRPFFYGPAHGHFIDRNTFVSTDAGWSANNVPQGIAVNGFYYIVSSPYVKDTCTPSSETALSGGFPASLVGDTVTFYYRRYPNHNAENVTWTLTQDPATLKWDVFHAPYDTTGGVASYFSKDFQPVQITLKIRNVPKVQETFDCRWDHTLNAILLNPYNDSAQNAWLASSLQTNTEAYLYVISDLYTPHGFGYPDPPVYVNDDTITPNDTARLAATPYRYHTYTMEFLPHEIRYLYDSVVVRRIPDRLIPPSNKYADIITKEPRSPAILFPAQFDIDNGDAGQYERTYFATHPFAPGCWDVTIGGKTYHAAHERLDYVKVWDVPKNVIIPGYPH